MGFDLCVLSALQGRDWCEFGFGFLVRGIGCLKAVFVAMAEWLQRIPQFEVTPGEEVPYFIDGLLSLRQLPLSWDASKAV